MKSRRGICYVPSLQLTEADNKHLNKLRTNKATLLLMSEATPRPTYQELAYHFGVPVGTIKSRLSRVRAKMLVMRQQNREKVNAESH